MQVVELIVYISAAVIIGMLIIGFLVNFDYGSIYNGLKDALFPTGEDELPRELQKLSAAEFGQYTYTCWRSCGFGEINKTCGSVLIEQSRDENGTLITTLNKGALFEPFLKLNWCDSLQCKSCGCGYKEDVEMGDIQLPHVVKLTCNSEGNGTLYITG